MMEEGLMRDTILRLLQDVYALQTELLNNQTACQLLCNRVHIFESCLQFPSNTSLEIPLQSLLTDIVDFVKEVSAKKDPNESFSTRAARVAKKVFFRQNFAGSMSEFHRRIDQCALDLNINLKMSADDKRREEIIALRNELNAHTDALLEELRGLKRDRDKLKKLLEMLSKEAGVVGNAAILRELESLQHKVEGQVSLSMGDLVRLEETLKTSNEGLVVNMTRYEEFIRVKEEFVKNNNLAQDMLTKTGGDPRHKLSPDDKSYRESIVRTAEEKSSLAVSEVALFFSKILHLFLFVISCLQLLPHYSMRHQEASSPSSSKEIASVKRELSSLSHDEAIQLLILLGCSGDLCKKSPEEVNGQYLNDVLTRLDLFWEIGDTKSEDCKLNNVLDELQRIREAGVPLGKMQEIRRNVLVKRIQSSFREMVEAGKVDDLQELGAMGSIAKIASEDINRVFTADLSDEEWGCKGVTALHISAAKGDLKMVRLLLLHRLIAVNAIDSENGWTPLHYACFHGCTEVVELLLSDSRVDINNAAYEDGWTPLYAACKNGRVQVVQLLLSNNQVDVNKENKIGYTPLYAACEGNHAEVVKILLRDNRVDINKKNKLGYTPLHTVCERGHVEVLRTLLTSDRLEVNEVDKVGRTSLHIACKKGHKNMVNILLSDHRVVDIVNKEAKDGHCPLHYACDKGYVEVVVVLLLDNRVDVNKKEKKNECTPFFISCYRIRVEVVKTLLESDRVDVNMDNKDKYTPLNYACERGNMEIVSILLGNSRVDMRRQNKIGNSPLHGSCEVGRMEVVTLLLSHSGEGVNDENKEGDTPLHIGCRRGDVEMVECLLDSGADINKQDEYGHTPLHKACGFGSAEVATFLLKNLEVDVNKEDQDGRSPFFCACFEGFKDVVEIMLNDDRVAIDKKDQIGRTPLYCACLKGHVEVVEALAKKGADINMPNQAGKTPLYCACYEGHLKVVNILLQDNRVDVNKADTRGKTALDVASTEEIKQLLRAHGAFAGRRRA